MFTRICQYLCTIAICTALPMQAMNHTLNPITWIAEKYQAYQKQTAQKALSNIIAELQQGRIPVSDICNLHIDALELDPTSDESDFAHLKNMLGLLYAKLDLEIQNLPTPQKAQYTYQQKDTDTRDSQRYSYDYEAIRKNNLQRVCNWIRNRLYTTSEIPLSCAIDFTIMQRAIMDIEHIIDWILRYDTTLNAYNYETSSGDWISAQNLNYQAQNCKTAIRHINSNNYNEDDVVGKNSRPLPFITRWKLRNRSLADATGGVITIPRLIGTTAAAAVGYYAYTYFTS